MVYSPDQSLRRKDAAAFLGMKRSTFDLVKQQIPSKPLYPGSSIHVWIVRDLINWRQSVQGPNVGIRTIGSAHADMAQLLSKL